MPAATVHAKREGEHADTRAVSDGKLSLLTRFESLPTQAQAALGEEHLTTYLSSRSTSPIDNESLTDEEQSISERVEAFFNSVLDQGGCSATPR